MKNVFRITILLIVVTFISCNKNKQSSKTLQGSTWKFTSLKIDGVSDSSLATLKFKEGNMYNEVISGTWVNHDSSQTDEITFVWQFRNKGKTFEISNQSDGDAALQCSMLSGIYQVTQLKNSNFSITSKSTIGYSNKEVAIELSKQ
jgi:hypothetical protein